MQPNTATKSEHVEKQDSPRIAPLKSAEELYEFTLDFEQEILSLMKADAPCPEVKPPSQFCLNDDTHIWRIYLGQDEWDAIRRPGFEFNLMSPKDLMRQGYETVQLKQQRKGERHPSLEIQPLGRVVEGPSYLASRPPTPKNKVRLASARQKAKGNLS